MQYFCIQGLDSNLSYFSSRLLKQVIENLFAMAPSSQIGDIHAFNQLLQGCGGDSLPMQVDHARNYSNVRGSINIPRAMKVSSGRTHIGMIQHANNSYSIPDRRLALAEDLVLCESITIVGMGSISVNQCTAISEVGCSQLHLGVASLKDSILRAFLFSGFTGSPCVSVVIVDFKDDSRARFVALFHDKECEIEETKSSGLLF